ncbi:hypothetical protein PF010_g9919 [Phytophthora fragariae]|uniref:Uncharacterized protein n=1 Tax=Phytophthora fragariae TaxID=53985 RepID=A0A6G0LA59_9STRA|nr:hypothetical protein PF010_g9919 [Phytophthora fragariae]KAE9233834.1 hypothetical protein PF004_g9549 [Phytophthora fragariae]
MASSTSLDAEFFDSVAELLSQDAPPPPESASDHSPSELGGISTQPTDLDTITDPTETKFLGELDQVIRRSKETSRLRLYRHRVRKERDYLQRQEKLLTARLTRLKEAESNQLRPRGNTSVGLSTSMWRAIADQQRQARNEAEVEQKQLKASIKAQEACIEALQGLYRSHNEEDKDCDIVESFNSVEKLEEKKV